MTLEERIEDDVKAAMKARDDAKVSTLRMLRSVMHNLKIDKKTDKLDDGEVMDVISKDIKKHRDSIEGFKRGNRADLVEKEEKELSILQSYMPAPLTRDEISAIVKEIITQCGATSKADTGKVMKLVMEMVKGRAEGKLVNEIVAGELK